MADSMVESTYWWGVRLRHAVLAVSNCVGHDGTSYAVLKHVEVEFWCGTCRCETGTQCSVHRVNVKAAHFGARMLKRRPPEGGGHAKQNRNMAFSGGVMCLEEGKKDHTVQSSCKICLFSSPQPAFPFSKPGYGVTILLYLHVTLHSHQFPPLSSGHTNIILSMNQTFLTGPLTGPLTGLNGRKYLRFLQSTQPDDILTL